MLKSCVSNSFNYESPILLTGPNRGGKSTYLRPVGLAVVCAQSWGFCWADKMHFSPFANILTALESSGKLGELSTFESEIEYAKIVLSLGNGPNFVMMDEIFHSTNANDGFIASKHFLTKLFGRLDCVSIISTHYIELAKHFSGICSPKMVLTHTKSDGTLEYTYKVTDGISDKSSVLEILCERGLVSAPNAP